MLVEAVRQALHLREAVHSGLGYPQITTLDIGGGLPWTYRIEEPAPSLDEYVTALKTCLPNLFSGDLKIITEFGRSVMAGCGWAASRVEYVKEVDGKRLAVIHLGADFLLRPVYRPDEWSHQFMVLDPTGAIKIKPLIPQTIVGPLCFGGDVLAKGLSLPVIEPNDWIIIRDVGAYTLSLWSRHCNRGIPLVLGYSGSATPKLSVLRPAETPEDVVTFWKG